MSDGENMNPRNFFSYFNKTHGQSLVEILVALSVAAILIGGATTAVTVYLRSNYETKTQQSAVFLAQELMDNTRSYAEGNWDNIYGLNKSSSTLYSLITSSSPFTASSSAESITIDNLTYTRSFYVDNVNRDLCGSGAITSSSTDACTTPGAAGVAEDPSTQLITVQVQLPAPRTAVIRLQEYVTRSKTSVMNQNDWVGGSGQESFSTSSGFPSAVNNRFASSSGSIAFATSGQIVLAGAVSDGGLVWATSSVPNLSYAESIVASSSYLYIGGNDSIGSRLEKRLISSGAIAAPDTGLVGYWPFDEGTGAVASDYSTSGIAGAGTLTTGPVWATGKYGGALYFNGTSSYVSVADSSALLPSSAITMAAWARREGPTNITVNDSILIAKGAGNYLRICRGGGENSTLFSVMTPTQVYSTSTANCPAVGEWHHYAGTYNGSVINIYVDGVAVATTSDTGAIVDTAGNLNIGRYDGGSYNFNGAIDDVRIYNRALSRAEIATLYAATPPTTWGMSYDGGGSTNLISDLAVDGSFIYTAGTLGNIWALQKRNISDGSIYGTGASAYWSFDEGIGTHVYDASGNGITGTLGPSATSPTWVTSTASMRFDGGDYITASTTQGLNPFASTTASAWFKTTSTVASTKILGKTTGCASTGYLIWMDENAVGDGRVSWWVGDGPWLDSPATSTYNDGVWHHVVGTYDGYTSRLYVDGNLSTSSARGVENPTSAAVFEIGGSTVGCGSGFVGEIDDVRIYQRALSASEVSTLYANGTSTATSTWSIGRGGGIFSTAALDVMADGSNLYALGWSGAARVQKRNAQSGVLIWESTPDLSPYGGMTGDSTYVYVAGHNYDLVNAQWSIVKLNKSDGVTAWSTSTNPSSNDDLVKDIAVDSSYVYVVGVDRSLGSSDGRWRMEKRNISDGSLVWATSSDFTSNDDIPYALTVDDTYMYVAGNEADNVVTSTVWRVEKRTLSDGSLTWAQRYTASSGSAYAIDDDTQFIYVTGKENTNAGGSAYQWRIEKRLK
jgi:Tfp pilus assembly protein PilV